MFTKNHGLRWTAFATPNMPVLAKTIHLIAFSRTLLAATSLLTFGASFSCHGIEVLHSFAGGTNGMNPRGRLLQHNDGSWYGTTETGGSYGYGSIFQLTTNGNVISLFSFNNTNGANPYGGLIYGSDGNFYGTTYNGGASGLGTIFRYTTNGIHKVLFSLNATGSNGGDGAGFPAGLVLGNDGDFYGVTYSGFGSGGTSSTYGKIFKFHVNPGALFGMMTTLYRFPSTFTSGAYPTCELVQGPDGYFYGTTTTGGILPYGNGTVFRVSNTGTFTSLAAFGGTNGTQPNAGLSVGSDGMLYGSTAGGGTSGLGTIFRITTNGTLASLVSFNGTNGSTPYGSLTLGADGNLYGATIRGGTTGNGTAFRMTTNGVLTTLCSFDGSQVGFPYAALRQGSDGNFYGCGYNGSIFKVTTNGELTHLAALNNNDGANPYATLVTGPDGNMYGTTFQGGLHGHGTIYTVSTNGVTQVLASFAGTNGSSPYGAVTFGPDGAIYGAATSGGNIPKGNGTLYRADLGGKPTCLGSFIGTNGANPYGRVVVTANGRIFGTTKTGGSSNLGSIFAANTNGAISSLYSLTTSSGNYPYAGLTMGPDGHLYGATYVNAASCFRITTNGVFTKISFPLSGSLAFGELTAGPDGLSLYGTCGGDVTGIGKGSVYRITTNGNSYNILLLFNNSNGTNPRSQLTLGPDGNLYGTTFTGGLFNLGTVFKVGTNGTLTSLLSFDGTNGSSPHASVVLANDGCFYGVTTYGGEHNAGTVYRLRARPFLLTQPAGQTNVVGSSVSMSVSTDGIPPFSYQWLKNGIPLQDEGHIVGATNNTLQLHNITFGDVGSYSVSVTNVFGSATSLATSIGVITPPVLSVSGEYLGFTSNGFVFSVSSPIGSILTIQSSTNLMDWTTLATLTNPTGLLIYTNLDSGNACQFYRAIQQ